MPINKRDRDRSSLLGGSMPQKTVYEVDAEIYGAIEKVDIGRQVAEAISIFSIFPDPAQPRRSVPSAVRAFWNGSPQMVSAMFSEWWRLAQEEMGTTFDLRAWVLQEDSESEADEAPVMGGIEASLRVLTQLAASIVRDGLTNPITIARRGDQYQLETGERRWLAYHLLYWLLQDEQWTRIPARVMDSVNVWRQASENAARQDLNAIGRARQYAVLLMDLWKTDEKAPRAFKPMEECSTDREYYAQVVGLSTPYGKGDLLLNTLGLTNRSTFEHYRRLLQLPEELWQQGDDENLSEGKLLSALDNLKKTGEVQAVTKSSMARVRKDRMRHFEKRFVKIEERELDFAIRASKAERAQIAAQFRALADKIEQMGNK